MSNESKIIIRLWTVTIQSEAVSNAEPQNNYNNRRKPKKKENNQLMKRI